MKGCRATMAVLSCVLASGGIALAAPQPSDAGPDPRAPIDAGTDATAPAEARPAIRITGTSVVTDQVARAAIGSPPAQDEDVTRWGQQAVRRIVEAYRLLGYSYARAWFDHQQEPGVLWFEIDEGRMRVAFVGIRSVTATLFRLRLSLPGGVFKQDALERSLAEQKQALQLVNVHYRVHETAGYDVTSFGEVVPARTLEIHVVRRESFGWALDISVSATWGVVPSLKHAVADLLWDDDRLLVEFDFAFPYRRYIFDADPKTTWVHGGLEASYRLPHFGRRTLDFRGFAPRVDSAVYFSQYARADLQLASFYLLRGLTLANLVSSWSDVELSLGVGADLARVFSLRAAPTASEDALESPADIDSARALARAAARWTAALPWTRRDRRTFANLLVDVALPVELRASLWGQHAGAWGRHRGLVRGRAVLLAGRVPFWDDVELAGRYQRVFFNNLYWTDRAVQLELAYLVQLWRDWFEVGIFHDVSLFEDRISSPSTLRLMNAFGPSLHILVLDQYALSIHQGLGFAPGKFSQTLSFTVETVF
jgi:hypothetical protein